MADFLLGDRVRIKTKQNTYEGMVLPSTEKEILMLKLDSGYNIGFKLKEIKIEKIGKISLEKSVPILRTEKKNLPKISIITTGGTITSRVDYKTGAVFPLTKPEQLLAQIPELKNLAEFKIVSPFSLFSEDMAFEEWAKIAEAVKKELEEADGVIVTHGTDTLHFTAAALSFALKNLNKPVALVGGQRSSDRGSFDGAQNLICAVHYCLSDIAEVAVVMHGTSSDDYCLAIRGTKVRKMHTSRRDAFKPMNDLPLAKIWPDGKIEVLNKTKERSKAKIELLAKFDPNVALIKFSPGLSPEVLEFYIKQGYKGIILEGTGLGHVSTQPVKKANSWLEAIKSAVKKGIFVGITSQCLYGRVDSFVYSAGRMLADAGVVYLEDMLPEVAYVKLSWALVNSKDIKKTMLENISGEINPKLSEKMFLN